MLRSGLNWSPHLKEKSEFSLRSHSQGLDILCQSWWMSYIPSPGIWGGISHLEIPCYCKSLRLWWQLRLFWSMPVAHYSLVSWRLKCSCLIKIIGLHVAVSGWYLIAYDAQEIILDELIILSSFKYNGSLWLKRTWDYFFLTTPLLFNKVPGNMSDSQGTVFYHVAHQERHGVQQ